MIGSFSRRATFALLALASITACRDLATAPTVIAPAPEAISRVVSDNAPQLGVTLVSKSIKYRDTGSKPARGRSGTAAIASRALLGMDGITTLETTTGEFDLGGATTGTLSKTQIKVSADDGKLLQTTNYNGLETATQVVEIAGLTPENTIDVQANVRGVDGRRTDVVTVTDTVRLRPDVRAEIVAPERASPGVPTVIMGYVSELNGHVGAYTDCNLYVNDRLAAQATDIWIDRGDFVTCRFEYVFAAGGAQQVRVSAENVRPGDWDLSNNSATAVVQTARPETAMSARGHVHHTDYESVRTYRQTYVDGVNSSLYEYVYDYRSSSQMFNLSASSTRGLDFTGGIELSMRSGASEYDGRVIDTATIRQSGPAAGTAESGNRCYSNIGPLFELRVCTQWTDVRDATGQRMGSTNVQYIHTASSAVYTSRTFERGPWTLPEGMYYVSSSEQRRGTFLPLGNSLDMRVRLLGAAGETMTAAVSVPLTRTLFPFNRDVSQCSSYVFGPSTRMETCQSDRVFQTMTTGFAQVSGT